MASAVEQGAKYAESHEWVKVEGDTATIGISDFAQVHLNFAIFLDHRSISTNINILSTPAQEMSLFTTAVILKQPCIVGFLVCCDKCIRYQAMTSLSSQLSLASWMGVRGYMQACQVMNRPGQE